MTEISKKEIEAAIKAFQMAHTAKVNIPLEQSMRDALEAAARVRAENDAFRDAVVTGLGAVKMNADGTTERVDLRAEANAGGPSGTVEALKRIAQLKEVRRGGGAFDYEPALSAMEMYEIAFDALSALTAGG